MSNASKRRQRWNDGTSDDDTDTSIEYDVGSRLKQRSPSKERYNGNNEKIKLSSYQQKPYSTTTNLPSNKERIVPKQYEKSEQRFEARCHRRLAEQQRNTHNSNKHIARRRTPRSAHRRRSCESSPARSRSKSLRYTKRHEAKVPYFIDEKREHDRIRNKYQKSPTNAVKSRSRSAETRRKLQPTLKHADRHKQRDSSSRERNNKSKRTADASHTKYRRAMRSKSRSRSLSSHGSDAYRRHEEYAMKNRSHGNKSPKRSDDLERSRSNVMQPQFIPVPVPVPAANFPMYNASLYPHMFNVLPPQAVPRFPHRFPAAPRMRIPPPHNGIRSPPARYMRYPSIGPPARHMLAPRLPRPNAMMLPPYAWY